LRQGEKFIGKGREKVEKETRGGTYIGGCTNAQYSRHVGEGSKGKNCRHIEQKGHDSP
jgi:hypothetical protein